MTDPGSQVVGVAADTTKVLSVWTHIVERRLEYLLGTLIAHQLGLLDQVITYGSGVC
jgi:hypothetical protein